MNARIKVAMISAAIAFVMVAGLLYWWLEDSRIALTFGGFGAATAAVSGLVSKRVEAATADGAIGAGGAMLEAFVAVLTAPALLLAALFSMF